ATRRRPRRRARRAPGRRAARTTSCRENGRALRRAGWASAWRPLHRRGSGVARRGIRGVRLRPGWRAGCATRAWRNRGPATAERARDAIGAVAERIEKSAVGTRILTAPRLGLHLGAAAQAARARFRRAGRRR